MQRPPCWLSPCHHGTRFMIDVYMQYIFFIIIKCVSVGEELNVKCPLRMPSVRSTNVAVYNKKWYPSFGN